MKIKKIIGLSIIFVILLALVGCGKNENIEKNENDTNEITNSNETNTDNTTIITKENTTNENENTEKNEIANTTSSETTEEKNDFKISYIDEKYETKNNEGTVIFRNERNIAEIKSNLNQEAADKIEKSLKEISDKNWAYLKESADNYTPHTQIYENQPYGVSYKIIDQIIMQNVITFEFSQTGSMGGVSWNATEFYSYDMKSGNLLKLEDMSQDANSIKTFLVKKVNEYVATNFQYVDKSNLDSKILDIINQNGNYGIINDKFVVILPKYSIGSGADGVRGVEINKNEINNYLLEKYKIK